MNLQNNVVIVTHQWVDGDGLIAIAKLKRFGENKIPGISSADIHFHDGDTDRLLEITKYYPTIVFVDKTPDGEFEAVKKMTTVRIEAFDHHPHDKFPGKTATSIVSEYLGLKDNLSQKLDRWASRFDFQTGGDPMDLRFLVKEMHHAYTEKEVTDWFMELMDACHETEDTKADAKTGREFFTKALEEHLNKDQDMPAKDIFQKWLERSRGGKPIEDDMHIINAAGKVLEVFGENKTSVWLAKVFNAVNDGQRVFQKAKEDLKKSEISVFGNIVLISAVTENPRFNRFVRSQQGNNMLPLSAQEKLGKGHNPIVLQIWPERKGFQIFGNGLKLRDVVGALRAELLKIRGKQIPTHWTVLKDGGTISNTDPLYYQTGDFEMLMWGSLTRSKVAPVDMPEETIKKAVTVALDQTYLHKDCKDCTNKGCPFYEWQLYRCTQRRRNPNAT
ncbi:MAG: hypothetical protein HYW70_03335 [Candidatus Nealsonbacteria bacterium]|nr:hypothetical protein [Candidatus Nealsonbacteria bacterium]